MAQALAATEILVNTVEASNEIEFTDKALDYLMPTLQKSVAVPELRAKASSLQVKFPSYRVAKVKSKEEIEGAALKLQNW